MKSNTSVEARPNGRPRSTALVFSTPRGLLSVPPHRERLGVAVHLRCTISRQTQTGETALFSLIVKGMAWADGQDRFPNSRVFEYTDAELAARFQPNGVLDIAALSQIPAVFVEETSGRGDQVARVGRLMSAHLVNRELVLEYTYDGNIPPLTNRHFQTFAAELGIADFQFSRIHWSVKSGDLFRSLLRNLQPRRSRPTVFQLQDPEVIEPTLVSAMIPFHPNFTPVYTALQQVATACGLRCRRADDIWENPAVIQDVVSLIDKSRVVICDCTGRNPNVFYEAGIAHALGREVILITQNAEDIPFDLRHLRYVQYLNNGEGLVQLSARLQQRLEAIA